MEIMGRLAPGVSLDSAQAALEVRFRNFVASTAVREEQLSNLPELVLMDGARGLDSRRLSYSSSSVAPMAMSGLILLIGCANIANLLLAEVVGWFQGRMEFGPRALGARSILADPRNPENQERVNRKIKFRESFRPFAPAVPIERAGEFFELDRESPFMLLVAQARDGRSRLPATTHVDGSARVQTVDRESNPLFHDLLRSFGELTGTPVLINTSMNVRGEPIVCTPAEGLACFLTTGMDRLVIDRFVLRKAEQPRLEAGPALPPAFAED
jgi:hypothetical protein